MIDWIHWTTVLTESIESFESIDSMHAIIESSEPIEPQESAVPKKNANRAVRSLCGAKIAESRPESSEALTLLTQLFKTLATLRRA